MLTVDFSRDAKKFIASMHPKHGRQVAEKIRQLQINPMQHDAKLLKGYPYHRVDSGEYRIIYDIEKTTLNILIVGKRNDDAVYKKLKKKF
jgi:mRNA interferase RelE/StbE